MSRNTIKLIVTAAILIIMISVALTVLKWAIRLLLPLAIIIAVAYFIYNFVMRKRG